MRTLRRFLCVLLVALPFGALLSADEPVPYAVVIEIDDAIGPATSDYILRTLDEAVDSGATLLIITMDTPGGLDTAMRDIIKGILASPIPVVTYVYPRGSRAASAGTYILYASHVAAMAPATNLGAATPVPIGGPPPGIKPPKSDDESEGDSEDESDDAPSSTPADAMGRKAINDAVAYIRGLAEQRGRNADWAERAVREAVSLSAESALRENVIDLMADNLPDLIKQLDGREVELATGTVVIETDGLLLEEKEPDWRTKLLATITNPTIAYLLLLVGIYGLLFEGYNPGALVPGVVGAICILLALFAFQVLPVNYAGLALIMLGVILMIAEALVPSFGALGFGGVLAFVFGSIILMDTDVPGYDVASGLIGGIAFIGALLTLGIIGVAMRARAAPIVSGAEQLIGSIGEARADFSDRGTVFIHSEIWEAQTSAAVHRGDRVRVVSMDGLQLKVEPVSDKEN
ncbi:MAG: nodulation protein NfeD [Gammaproteobacteria bacterium]